jgi:hypothetical protein
VAGAKVTLSYDGKLMTTTTQYDSIAEASLPFFGFEGDLISMTLNSVATLTAEYDGQIVTRVYRAIPDAGDADVEQQINLVIPDVGAWTPEPSAGYTSALKIISNEIWMGGPAGLIRRDLTTGATLTENTGIASGVAALATDAQGRVWALGAYDQAAFFDGIAWSVANTNLIGLQRAIAVTNDGSVWAGGDEGLSRFANGAWQAQPDFNGSAANLVMALLGAADGSLWVATWEGGAAHRASNGDWSQFTTDVSAINSDRVAGLAESSAGIWFALGNVFKNNRFYGGVSLYAPSSNTWQTFTQTHGIPAAGTRTIAVDGQERVWVSGLGAGGVARSISGAPPMTWTTYSAAHGLNSNDIGRLAAGDDTAFAASVDGVNRFAAVALGASPVASITSAAPVTAMLGSELTWIGQTQDADETGQAMLAYEWMSDLDGPICSMLTCTVKSSFMQAGVHAIQFRAMDDEGMWSTPVSTSVRILPPQRYVYLPALRKSP